MNSPVPKATGSRPLVVVLEDDNGVRRSLQLLLQGRGFDVKAYANAGALLSGSSAARAACFVVDFRLSETNGIAVLESLRARGAVQPAILMTAFGSLELVEQARAAGFSEVLAKPLKPRALTTSLERLTSDSARLNRMRENLA